MKRKRRKRRRRRRRKVVLGSIVEEKSTCSGIDEVLWFYYRGLKSACAVDSPALNVC